MNILSILEDQNPWWQEPAIRTAARFPVRRDLQFELLDQLVRADERRAVVVIGARQVGKTTILRQSIDDLLEADVPARDITYFDASDPRVTEEVDLREIVAHRPGAKGGDVPRAPRFLFFDEIGGVPQWDRWLKQAVDEGVGRIVATDSAATLLREGGRESGVGRWDERRLGGLTFREYVRLQGERSQTFEGICQRIPRGKLLERYLRTGGFPEHAAPETTGEDLDEIRRRIRDDIADRAITRDLARFGIDVQRARALFVYLVQDSGAILTVSKRAEDLGAERPTVGSWLQLLEDTLLIARLPSYHRRASARLKTRPRIYAADHGLVTAFATAPFEDPEVRARVFEAVVLRHLRDVEREGGGSLGYFRKGDLEVDFVLRIGDELVAVEVTSSRRVRNEKLERLIAASEALSASRRILVHGGSASGSARNVVLLPLPDLLSDPREAVGEALG